MDARFGGLMVLLAAGLVATALVAKESATPAPVAAHRTMQAFASERELQALFVKWRAQAESRRVQRQSSMAMESGAAPMPPAPAPAAAAKSAALMAPGAVMDASDAESITNVQTQGVDEGDIVKKHGDYLIVLRRGRLFTIRIGDDSLRQVSTVNAYAPDADPHGTWYDEMLVSDDTVVVIGYSYARDGTEIGLFDLDAQGGLRYRDTYQLCSNDYYSTRN